MVTCGQGPSCGETQARWARGQGWGWREAIRKTEDGGGRERGPQVGFSLLVGKTVRAVGGDRPSGGQGKRSCRHSVPLTPT